MLGLRIIGLLCVLGGCDHLFGINQHMPLDADLSDSNFIPPDAAPCNGTLYGRNGGSGAGLIQICVANPPPSMGLTLTEIDTDTDCDYLLDQGDHQNTKVCIKIAPTIAIDSVVETRGQWPLVLVGTMSISLTGTLDLRGSVTGAVAAGSNWSGCAAADGLGTPTGGAGGAGGSFKDLGGAGGAAGGGVATMASPTNLGDRVRGGCAGGTGGAGPSLGSTGTAMGGSGGPSGGAVYMISGGTIEIDGIIDASGGGGGGGAFGSSLNVGSPVGGGGGGGGGSGGMIGLDAPTIVFGANAKLSANCGGGGGGGGEGAGAAGNPGGDPDPKTIDVVGKGGMGGNGSHVVGGGDGGDGAAGVSTTPEAGASSVSGGGGGGAFGYILAFTRGAVPSGATSPELLAQ